MQQPPNLLNPQGAATAATSNNNGGDIVNEIARTISKFKAFFIFQ
jgi:hypothetical protein